MSAAPPPSGAEAPGMTETPTPPPPPPMPNLDVGGPFTSLGRLTSDVAHNGYRDLHTLMDSLFDKHKGERSELLLDYAQQTRHRLLRALVLTRWAMDHAASSEYSAAAIHTAKVRGGALAEAADALWSARHTLLSAPQAAPPVAPAGEVLASGSLSARLPRAIVRTLDEAVERPDAQFCTVGGDGDGDEARRAEEDSRKHSNEVDVRRRLATATHRRLQACLPLRLPRGGDICVLQWRSTCGGGAEPERADREAAMSDGFASRIGVRGAWSADVSVDGLSPDALLRVFLVRISVGAAADAPGSGGAASGGDPTASGAPRDGGRSDELRLSSAQRRALVQCCNERMSQAALIFNARQEPSNGNALSLDEATVTARTRATLMVLGELMSVEICTPLAMEILVRQAGALARAPFGEHLRAEIIKPAADGAPAKPAVAPLSPWNAPAPPQLIVHYWRNQRRAAQLVLLADRGTHSSRRQKAPALNGELSSAALDGRHLQAAPRDEEETSLLRIEHVPPLGAGVSRLAVHTRPNATSLHLEHILQATMRARSRAVLAPLQQQLEAAGYAGVWLFAGDGGGCGVGGEHKFVQTVSGLADRDSARAMDSAALIVQPLAKIYGGVSLRVESTHGFLRARFFGAAVSAAASVGALGQQQRLADSFASDDEERAAVSRLVADTANALRIASMAQLACALGSGVSLSLPRRTAPAMDKSGASVREADCVHVGLNAPPYTAIESDRPTRFVSLALLGDEEAMDHAATEAAARVAAAAAEEPPLLQPKARQAQPGAQHPQAAAGTRPPIAVAQAPMPAAQAAAPPAAGQPAAPLINGVRSRIAGEPAAVSEGTLPVASAARTTRPMMPPKASPPKALPPKAPPPKAPPPKASPPKSPPPKAPPPNSSAAKLVSQSSSSPPEEASKTPTPAKASTLLPPQTAATKPSLRNAPGQHLSGAEVMDAVLGLRRRLHGARLSSLLRGERLLLPMRVERLVSSIHWLADPDDITGYTVSGLSRDDMFTQALALRLLAGGAWQVRMHPAPRVLDRPPAVHRARELGRAVSVFGGGVTFSYRELNRAAVNTFARELRSMIVMTNIASRLKPFAPYYELLQKTPLRVTFALRSTFAQTRRPTLPANNAHARAAAAAAAGGGAHAAPAASAASAAAAAPTAQPRPAAASAQQPRQPGEKARPAAAPSQPQTSQQSQPALLSTAAGRQGTAQDNFSVARPMDRSDRPLHSSIMPMAASGGRAPLGERMRPSWAYELSVEFGLRPPEGMRVFCRPQSPLMNQLCALTEEFIDAANKEFTMALASVLERTCPVAVVTERLLARRKSRITMLSLVRLRAQFRLDTDAIHDLDIETLPNVYVVRNLVQQQRQPNTVQGPPAASPPGETDRTALPPSGMTRSQIPSNITNTNVSTAYAQPGPPNAPSQMLGASALPVSGPGQAAGVPPTRAVSQATMETMRFARGAGAPPGADQQPMVRPAQPVAAATAPPQNLSSRAMPARPPGAPPQPGMQQQQQQQQQNMRPPAQHSRPMAPGAPRGIQSAPLPTWARAVRDLQTRGLLELKEERVAVVKPAALEGFLRRLLDAEFVQAAASSAGNSSGAVSNAALPARAPAASAPGVASNALAAGNAAGAIGSSADHRVTPPGAAIAAQSGGGTGVIPPQSTATTMRMDQR